MIKINVKGYIVPGLSIFFGLFSIYKIYDFFKKIINEHIRELVFIKCELYQSKNNTKLLEMRFISNMNSINNKIFLIEQNIKPNHPISENDMKEITDINEKPVTNMIINEINNNELRLKDLEYDCITKNDICTPYKKNNSFTLPDIIKNLLF
jgi:uncharacterized protein YdcH (DUF465 family)